VLSIEEYITRRTFIMKNCEMKLDGNILTITVDISKEYGTSSSGKSIIIGSTEGNVSIPEKEDIKIGLNVYRKA
jgi:hypothetical protein